MPRRPDWRLGVRVAATLVALGGVWVGPAGAAPARQSGCLRLDDFYLCDAVQPEPASGPGNRADRGTRTPLPERAPKRAARRDAASACPSITLEATPAKESPLCT